MMKKLVLMVLMVLGSSAIFAQNKDAVLGKWLNSSGEGQIEITKRADKFFGKLVWLKEPNDESGKPKLDKNNPTNTLRSKPLLGLEILKNFDFEDGKWTNGTIYDPKTGKTYSCNISLKGSDQLNIRGYIGISLIGRTDVWKRLK